MFGFSTGKLRTIIFAGFSATPDLPKIIAGISLESVRIPRISIALPKENSLLGGVEKFLIATTDLVLEMALLHRAILFLVRNHWALSLLSGCVVLCTCIGCGSTKQSTATEQLLMSNAVDATVSKLDFSPLSYKKVFLDSTYLNKPITTVSPIPQPLAIDSNYLISSLRQQMFAAGVLLVDSREDAEIIAEPRVGALGIDGHDLIYGVPASNAISTAATAVSGTTLLPPIPELSLARREDKMGANKIAVFAYYKDSRLPYWQSGVAQSNSDSRSTWVMGVGPFQRGSVRSGTEFAGSQIVPTQATPGLKKNDNLEQYLS
ncbi:MAG TPA: hypothetical protein DCF63_10610, partial [Planctomycetaceae bacterium]|nr:hypothetical protein [Planctomycetaceae bacterium]